MTEEDRQIWKEAYDIYANWKDRMLTDRDWAEWAMELNGFATRNHFQENPLADRMAMMLSDLFGDIGRAQIGPEAQQMSMLGGG